MGALVEITIPDTEDVTDAVIERWLHRVGDTVHIHEPLLEINTDKAVVEVPSPSSGILREILKNVGDSVTPGDTLGRIEPSNTATTSTEPARATHSRNRAPKDNPDQKERELSPAVRQLVKKHLLDVSKIHGTGRDGRITHDDVQNHLKMMSSSASPVPGATRRISHSPTRRRIAEHMVQSILKTAPHVTAVFEADLSAVVEHRNRTRGAFAKRGIHLTYTAYFVAAAAKALQTVPEINSRWHDHDLEIYAESNIGIATATDAGLLVPVVHSAQTLDLLGIASRLHDLTNRARIGKLTPEDLRGGTFTITNHGVSGSLIATPIIHQPQSAILGIGKVEKRAVVVESDGGDAIQIKPMAYVTLTIDHRALDGHQANAYLSSYVGALTHWPAIE